jgi:mono/diheme cytochrome c family protein
VLTLLALSSRPAEAAPDPGREIYVAKCQSCHGVEGKGDGPAARALPKRPRDFTSPAFWSSTTEQQVRTVILTGLPGTIMRGFPMPDQQLDDLVRYLQSLATAG